MPANLSPEYKAAEAAFRKTREPQERLHALRDMLRTIPKHKGTEHLQADIKARIKDLSEQLEGGARKAGGHGGPALVVRPEGAAQLALLGPPNSGKSSLHARLTGSNAHAGPYPFTTQFPEAGMLPFEDIHLQLVDLPPVSAEHPVPWLAQALQTADAALLVVDLADPSCLEQLQSVQAWLAQQRVTLGRQWPGDAALACTPDDDPFALRLPALLLANKADGNADAQAELQVLRELSGAPWPMLAVSASTGQGLDELGAWIFQHLGIVRVYTKIPGHAADKHRPFTLRHGQTVGDVARQVHGDVARSLRFARVWGHSAFDGQQVGPEHVVDDGDVVELHA
ncbi:TGS domain-containing protein [Ramlibacter sp. G-1-2-2]|uniref:TGS domain-containing protein n=1 Tax=Ramlibacter agri TaxID=2728837 RepID=A0A848H0W5_9BURK|nr:TGS domain-containing protein [Ramlibacter agri]